MEGKLLNNRDKWLRIVWVTLLGSAAIEIYLILYGTLFGKKDVSEFVPWTFHTIWEIAALVGTGYAVKKCDIKPGDYFAALMLGTILVGITGTVIPDSLKLEANYYGVESHISVEYDARVLPGFLYRKDDPELKRDFYESKSYNEHVRTRGFLFWQTGLAYGFNPICIDGYNGGHGFLNRIELFFTAGPMVIVESSIKGLNTNFIILMLAQIVWFLIRKEQVWWD